MQLFDTRNRKLNMQDVKERLQNLNYIPSPTLSDVHLALGKYYVQAVQLQKNNYLLDVETADGALAGRAPFLPGIGSQLLEDIEKTIYKHPNRSPLHSQVTAEALNALALIIPGSIYIEPLAKVLIKYLLAQNVIKRCEYC